MTDLLIMLTGSIGSGKSTAAEILTKYNFIEDFFAKPLKDFGLSLGFEHHQIYGTQEQKLEINQFWGISGREFLQKFGSEVCRDALPGIIPGMNFNNRTLWARVMESKIQKHKRLVISDGRFLDEAALVKEYKGVIIRLKRRPAGNTTVNTSVDTSADKPIGDFTTHKSETEISAIKADYEIDNNGSLEDLENQLIGILSNEGCNV